jgi:hypothetical protein
LCLSDWFPDARWQSLAARDGHVYIGFYRENVARDRVTNSYCGVRLKQGYDLFQSGDTELDDRYLYTANGLTRMPR